jgi:hypothetical protein
MTRLVQIKKGGERRVALAEETNLRILGGCTSIYSLAQEAITAGAKLSELARRKITQELLEYDPIHRDESDWRILPPIDHPEEPSRCLVSGTGLTHLGSARDRQGMHSNETELLTDSMKMFRWGIEGGRPDPGRIGTPPEWFYKGTGTILRAHGEPLDVPPYAEDGGEEGEIACIYLIGVDGKPRRLGMAPANEFSDHKFEKKNYLNLAGSKLRTCALGPEITIDAEFESVPGEVTIERGGAALWTKKIRTGNAEMCHSLRNIEHHHFKHDQHRRPGDIHVHFLGADCLSFGEGVHLADGDIMQVKFEGFGRPLRNPLHAASSADFLVTTIPLG